MTPFALIFIIVLATIAIFALFARAGQREAKKIGDRAAELLLDIDNQYEEFIDTKMLLAGKEQVIDLNVEKLTEEAMEILQPGIEGLLAHINANKNYSSVKVDYYSRHFKTAVPTVDAYFVKSYHNKGVLLPDSDEEKFVNSFAKAIRSDLKKRVLQLKAGS